MKPQCMIIIFLSCQGFTRTRHLISSTYRPKFSQSTKVLEPGMLWYHLQHPIKVLKSNFQRKMLKNKFETPFQTLVHLNKSKGKMVIKQIWSNFISKDSPSSLESNKKWCIILNFLEEVIAIFVIVARNIFIRRIDT